VHTLISYNLHGNSYVTLASLSASEVVAGVVRTRDLHDSITLRAVILNGPKLAGSSYLVVVALQKATMFQPLLSGSKLLTGSTVILDRLLRRRPVSIRGFMQHKAESVIR